MPKTEEIETQYTIDDVLAAFPGASRRAVQDLCRAGKVAHMKLGGQRFFDPEQFAALKAYLTQQAQQASPMAAESAALARDRERLARPTRRARR